MIMEPPPSATTTPELVAEVDAWAFIIGIEGTGTTCSGLSLTVGVSEGVMVAGTNASAAVLQACPTVPVPWKKSQPGPE